MEKEEKKIEEVHGKEKIKRIFLELLPYVIILIVVVLFRSFIATPVIVSGESMSPTLDGGELMILNKLEHIDRFDVVVVRHNNEDLIKRVIAMPGETISCENGKVYVNDRLQEESYSKGTTKDFEKVKLGDNEYFVMGDNRENSADSRIYGAFNDKQLKGTAKFVLFPFGKFGKIK